MSAKPATAPGIVRSLSVHGSPHRLSIAMGYTRFAELTSSKVE